MKRTMLDGLPIRVKVDCGRRVHLAVHNRVTLLSYCFQVPSVRYPFLVFDPVAGTRRDGFLAAGCRRIFARFLRFHSYVYDQVARVVKEAKGNLIFVSCVVEEGFKRRFWFLID